MKEATEIYKNQYHVSEDQKEYTLLIYNIKKEGDPIAWSKESWSLYDRSIQHRIGSGNSLLQEMELAGHLWKFKKALGKFMADRLTLGC